MNVVNKNPQIIRGSPHGNPEAVSFEDYFPDQPKPYTNYTLLSIKLQTLNRAYSFASYRDRTKNQTVPLQLIVCIFNYADTLYSLCKMWGDCKQGVMTQCVIYRNVIRPHVQLCANLFLKINAKLGGKNIILDQPLGSWNADNAPCMIIGIHVMHPFGMPAHNSFIIYWLIKHLRCM